MKNKFYHPLMYDNITLQDRKVAANFLLKNNIFTQSKKVKEFEKLWSKWLGVKYSVFVNSGSSANFLTMLAIKYLYGSKVIVPPLHGIQILYQLLKMTLNQYLLILI